MDDPIANFMVMTGTTSEEVAIQFLSLADFDLTAAVVLYNIESGQAALAVPAEERHAPSHGVFPTGVQVPADDPDPLLMDGLTPLTASPSNPSPSRVATLSAVDPSFPARPPGNRTIDNPDRSIFTDVTGVKGEALRRLFTTPAYVRTDKSLESVCALAQRKDRWVLVAVRDSEFRSSCVTRDVWNNEAMANIADHLECVEYDVRTSLGEQCCHSFRITPASLPSLFLLDPYTLHRECTLDTRPTAANGLDGAAVIEQVLTFIGTNGSPRQRHSTLERESEAVDVDDEEDEETNTVESAEAAGDTEPQQQEQKKQPSASAPAAAVTLDEWAQPEGAAGGYRLRVRLPRSNPTLHLRPDTPVSLLLRFWAYRVHADDPATYAAPPSIEVRAGFPPQLLQPPASEDVLLSMWGGVRSGDTLTVHIHP